MPPLLSTTAPLSNKFKKQRQNNNNNNSAYSGDDDVGQQGCQLAIANIMTTKMPLFYENWGIHHAVVISNALA